MTTELYPGPAQYTVSGTGPYAVGHEYTTGALAPQVRLAGQIVTLSSAQFNVTPLSGPNGDLFLTAQAAADYDGWQLTIQRVTVIEQGFLGQGAREKGLEAQLDRLAQAGQENQGAVARALRLATGSLPPVVPEDRRTLVWDALQGLFAPGPSIDSILAAEALLAALVAVTAQAATLAPGASATASFDAQTGLLSLGIPRGEKGETGASGAGSGDMVAAQNLADLADVAAARINLGLKQAALRDLSADPDFGIDPALLADRQTIGARIDASIGAAGTGFHPNARWQAVTRVAGTSYVNTTPHVIGVAARAAHLELLQADATWLGLDNGVSGTQWALTNGAMVGPGQTYRLSGGSFYGFVREFREPL